MHADFLDDRGCGACFILRTEGSDRAILANEEFEFFFESAVSMAARLQRAPVGQVRHKPGAPFSQSATVTRQGIVD